MFCSYCKQEIKNEYYLVKTNQGDITLCRKKCVWKWAIKNKIVKRIRRQKIKIEQDIYTFQIGVGR